MKSFETKDQNPHVGQRGKQKIMGRKTSPVSAFSMGTCEWRQHLSRVMKRKLE